MVESDFTELRITQEIWYKDRRCRVDYLTWNMDSQGPDSKVIGVSSADLVGTKRFTEVMHDLRFEPIGMDEVSDRLRDLETQLEKLVNAPAKVKFD